MSTTSPESRRFVQLGEELRVLTPWNRQEWLCHPDLVAADKLLVVRANMDPGCCHPFHRHPHREEVLYVLHGRAEQWVEKERRLLRAGEAAHIPAGMVHGTYNPYPEPLIFLAILSPAQLPPELAKDPDPFDVSDQEPWKSLRDGLPPCKLLEVPSAG